MNNTPGYRRIVQWWEFSTYRRSGLYVPGMKKINIRAGPDNSSNSRQEIAQYIAIAASQCLISPLMSLFRKQLPLSGNAPACKSTNDVITSIQFTSLYQLQGYNDADLSAACRPVTWSSCSSKIPPCDRKLHPELHVIYSTYKPAGYILQTKWPHGAMRIVLRASDKDLRKGLHVQEWWCIRLGLAYSFWNGYTLSRIPRHF